MQLNEDPILVIGGNGYTGQFLIESLSKKFSNVFGTFRNDNFKTSEFTLPREWIQLDLCDASASNKLREIFNRVQPNIVFNCAANSNILSCEKNEEAARAANVPRSLFQCFQELVNSSDADDRGNGRTRKRRRQNHFLLIHLSSDQVYPGAEGHETYLESFEPLSAETLYGKLKIECENVLAELLPFNHLILRPSVILGPPPRHATAAHSTFLQFIVNNLTSDRTEPIGLFSNEFRNFVSVFDLVEWMSIIAQKRDDLLFGKIGRIFNAGGSERLSRYDLGVACCRAKNLDPEAFLKPEALTAQKRSELPYHRPPDLSMKSEALEALTNRRAMATMELISRSFE